MWPGVPLRWRHMRQTERSSSVDANPRVAGAHRTPKLRAGCARSSGWRVRITRVSLDLITTAEAAQILGLEAAYVRELIRAGAIQAERRVGHIYLIERDTVTEYALKRPSHTRRRRDRSNRITPVMIDVLHLLSQADACTTAELAPALNRHEGNVRKYLAAWRDRGFVTSHPTDPISYCLTDDGRAYLNEMTAKAS